MKAIVFGGAGFVGSHVADALSNAGYEVLIYDTKPSKYLRSDQQMIVGDILDAEKVKKAMQECDYVYNFAGIADLDDATTKPIDTIRLNIEGNANILEASRKAKVKRFVYASTIYVYSSKGGFYRCSKQAAELYIEEYQRKYGLPFTILRYGTVYGPRADLRNSVYRYVYQAIKQRCIHCSGTGEEMREYINVKDAARLSVEILDEKYKNQYIIITGHHPIKFRQLLETIREMLDNKIDIEFEALENPHHYTITPYSFTPKIGYKLTTNYYTDIGQGLLEIMNEIFNEFNKQRK